jgi:hypothetical protein
LLFDRKATLAAACALGIFACLAAAPAGAAGCFTAAEAPAASFRALQQELNVAALNCRTLDPAVPTFSARYNDFVGKFGNKLKENAQALRAHFTRSGENFDKWMTIVANDAGRRVYAEPDYCQRAWENLDKVLTLEPAQLDGFATELQPAKTQVQVCSEAKPTRKHKI